MPLHNDSMPALPTDLPWPTQAYLLLDGVSLENPRRWLHEWHAQLEFEPLYQRTRFAELVDILPCLATLGGAGDPVLRGYLDNSQHEWGYLIFSSAERPDLLRHLRWLLTVDLPLGEEVMLRLADPAVMNALLGHAVSRGDQTLFGPIEQVVMPDAMTQCWNRHCRAGRYSAGAHDRRYALSAAELELLEEVSFRSVVTGLDAHLMEYFPHYRADLSRPARWRHLHGLASEAYEQGFSTELDITRYANLFALLGDDALERHPDIAQLLTERSSLTPAQRIEQAARLAYVRTENRDPSV